MAVIFNFIAKKFSLNSRKGMHRCYNLQATNKFVSKIEKIICKNMNAENKLHSNIIKNANEYNVIGSGVIAKVNLLEYIFL